LTVRSKASSRICSKSEYSCYFRFQARWQWWG